MWCVKNIWRVKQKISRNCAWFDFETMREGQKTKLHVITFDDENIL